MFETIMWLWKQVQASGKVAPPLAFTSEDYQRHNRRRQEHLATLELPLAGKSVLEVGGGIGDHTSFFLDRGCRVTVTDAREDNIEVVQFRYPDLPSFVLDIETTDKEAMPSHQIVYAYGLLYHLADPARAIDLFSGWADELLLLETVVSYGGELAINLVSEHAATNTQAASGTGCRPTRGWIRAELMKHFDHVYMPLTQPAHREFPTDWSRPDANEPASFARAVFIASRRPLSSPKLTLDLPDFQPRG